MLLLCINWYWIQSWRNTSSRFGCHNSGLAYNQVSTGMVFTRIYTANQMGRNLLCSIWILILNWMSYLQHTIVMVYLKKTNEATLQNFTSTIYTYDDGKRNNITTVDILHTVRDKLSVYEVNAWIYNARSIS